ncbi:hypothetical protein [Nocardia mangyaensis]|uniref:hypothetical protein n=1 Tax=Nocardia mangyaensis TaxID=2213200 RepID=UPI002676AF54|nr:hypothetical protein [Nocardia mangyaensis]MDO3651326.1 hypothetical protein [Nocardia mangyaensis]
MKILIGSKIGKLEVMNLVNIEYSHNTIYNCVCECGNLREINYRDLIRIKNPTCGDPLCRLKNNLTGQNFDRLTVIAYAGQKNRQSIWSCVCECGNETIVRGHQLLIGHTTSCGCKNKLPYGDAALNTHYRNYIKSATSRNLEFNLNKEQFKKVITKNCYYCNQKPEYSKAKEFKYCNGNIKVNGIDRIDNKVGYIYSNVVPCCSKCNFLKATLNQKEFIDLCKKITENLNPQS